MTQDAAALRLTNICFSRGARGILTGINWSVARRQVAAVLGANGSGKTTLLRIAAGYLWPQRGTVDLLGRRLGEFPVAQLRARMGIVEATGVYPFDDTMTALAVAITGYFSTLTLAYVQPRAAQVAHARQNLARVGLAGHAEQRYWTLSTGERMRCLIARALVRKPDLLLLDEPTAGLDLPAREAVLATLARLNRAPGAPAVVLVTHHLEELLPQTSNVLLLSRDGRPVATGRPEKVLTDACLSQAYGMKMHVHRRGGRYHAHVDPRSWDDLLR